MDIDWNDIYVKQPEGTPRKMKFAILPKVLPWGRDFQENVDLTVEWLIREAKADDVRFGCEPAINSTVPDWYTIESEPGQFLHCCYPQDLLKFRGQFESLREQIMWSDVQNLSMITQTADSARTLLWSAWNCLGGDGRRIEPSYEEKTDEDGLPMFQPIVAPSEWPRVWNYRCYKCCDPLPKALKLWQKMQYSKLKGLQ